MHAQSLDYTMSGEVHPTHSSHKCETRAFSLDASAIAAVALRRDSIETLINDSRRSSLTPESPYMCSDETRARQTLLEPDIDDLNESSADHATNHCASEQTTRKRFEQLRGTAGPIMGMGQETITGGNNHDCGDEDVQFFVASPETPQREKFEILQRTNSDERRNSLVPESPYQVSDETRARADSLDIVPVEPIYMDIRRNSFGMSSMK